MLKYHFFRFVSFVLQLLLPICRTSINITIQKEKCFRHDGWIPFYPQIITHQEYNIASYITCGMMCLQYSSSCDGIYFNHGMCSYLRFIHKSQYVLSLYEGSADDTLLMCDNIPPSK